MNRHSDSIEKKKDFIKKYNSLSDGLIVFYKKLFDVQEKTCEKLPENIADFLPVRTASPPFLIKENIRLDAEIINQLELSLFEIIEIAGELNPGMDFSMLKGAFVSFAGEAIVKLLLHDFSYFENKAAELRLDSPEFLFMIHNVFKPLLVRGRESVFPVHDREAWHEGTCPYCGYMPDFSKIIESSENRRFLHCSLCECEWEFSRLRCHSCGNTEQSTLGFFEFEDDPDYRAYYCDKCRHYIKSIRIPGMRSESVYDLTVEDVITGFLDSTMIEKNYNRI